ncbi:hypothetical protein HYU95_04400 [Candidatus Daviesbacteria bacterium]|nr:hypothetical protein [Candidatus Daviesbacteria bacterium]
MKRNLIELGVLFISSLISVAVVFYKIPASLLQQSIGVMIVILLIVVHRFVFSRKQSLPFIVSLALTFLVSIFLQLLVLSSGGFYSPFLILFHLFAISASFLIGVRIAIGFLGFSIIALVASTLLDSKLYGILINDPWSAILYILSFVVIVPLYNLISSTYHLEKAVSKILSSQLKLTTTQLEQKGAQLELTKKRDESLMGGLSDAVITTDLNLGIVSINEAAVKILNIGSDQARGQPIFALLNLKDIQSRVVDAEFLEVEEIIRSGTTHLLSNLLLYTKGAAIPKKINLRIHPTKNLEGQIDQLVFIISNYAGGGHTTVGYQDIDEAIKRNKALLETVKKELLEKSLLQLDAKVELLGKTEEDILTAIQIANHGIKPGFSLIDAADLMQRTVEGEKGFAKSLGVPLNFSLSKEFMEKFTAVDFEGKQPIPLAFTSQYFTVFTEPHWINFLMKKILDLSILLSTKERNPKVDVLVSYDAETIAIEVSCISSQKQIPDTLPDNGNGLESYLIKTITTLLNIPFSVIYKEESRILNFTVKLSKTPVR